MSQLLKASLEIRANEMHMNELYGKLRLLFTLRLCRGSQALPFFRPTHGRLHVRCGSC